MPLIIGTVRNQRSAGTTATTLSDNINFGFRAHALHLDVYCLVNTTKALGSLLTMVQKLSQVRINTTSGQPESTIDGQDLHDFMPTALARTPYKTVLTTVDNDPQAFTLAYPLSPMFDDPTEPFGLDAGRGTQIDMVWTADGTTTTDTYTYDITVEGLTNAPSKGYTRFIRDAQTGVVGQGINTKVYGKRFLGVMNFQTTSFDDLAAAAAIDVTTIRTQAILESSAVILGPMRPQRSGATLYLPQITASPPIVLDNGSHFQNFGIANKAGDLGFDINQKGTIELQTVAGATDAYRTYPTTLI